MNKKVIIFDFDGVLVDSLELSYSINRYIMPGLKYAEWQSWFEGNFYKKVRKEHRNNDYQNSFFVKYNEGVVNLLPIKGMVDVVKELAKKYTLVIISSSTQKAIIDYLNKNELREYFVDVLGMETHKSKVYKFHIILEKYKIKPNETLIITDTVGDIKEANEVGIKSLGVIWGVHNKSKLKEANPYFIAKDPNEIIAGIELVLN